jgi:hypothetical protein
MAAKFATAPSTVRSQPSGFLTRFPIQMQMPLSQVRALGDESGTTTRKSSPSIKCIFRTVHEDSTSRVPQQLPKQGAVRLSTLTYDCSQLSGKRPKLLVQVRR